MISVAIVADRRREVFFLEERTGVDALFVFFHLIRGDSVAFHVVFIRMASTASFRDIPGKRPGFGMIRRKNTMAAMAVCAHCDFCVSIFKKPAVLAGPV